METTQEINYKHTLLTHFSVAELNILTLILNKELQYSIKVESLGELIVHKDLQSSLELESLSEEIYVKEENYDFELYISGKSIGPLYSIMRRLGFNTCDCEFNTAPIIGTDLRIGSMESRYGSLWTRYVNASEANKNRSDKW